MKKRIGILSRHAVPNFGSILQAYALQEALDNLGAESEYVDYRIPRDYPFAEAMRSSGVLGPVRAIPKAIGAYKFENMRKKVLKQSRRVENPCDLGGLLSEYSVLCVGGDQVWNEMSDGCLEGAYLLESATDDSYKFSYSSSFGKNGLESKEMGRAKKAFSRFDRLSVREESGQKILEGMGLTAETVVDPVHLFTKDEWLDRIPESKPFGVHDRYCLIYNLHPSFEFDAYASRACRSLGMNVISIRPTLRRTMGKNIFYPSLSEFLWLFDNADCVLTDSFHGTAFSILFNTPFIDILPEHNAERNKAILARFGLDSRISSAIDPIYIEPGIIDWDNVNKTLAHYRKDSWAYLKDVVEEFNRISVNQ